MRIVLDTNIVVSALLWKGTPYRLLDKVRQQPNPHFYSSAVLLEELADVLQRRSIAQRLGRIDRTPGDILAAYIGLVELVKPKEVPAVILDDPDDDQVLACALTARADLIVSGDRDLIDLGNYQGIRIATASELLKELE